jgi:hypothetical protein
MIVERFRLTLLPAILLPGLLAGLLAAADAQPAAHPQAEWMVTSEQIETDWLRQLVVRSLPPDPLHVTTAQDAGGGCDGVIDGGYGFHTAEQDDPWWQVDLGRTATLDRIVIYNRGDGVSARAARLRILLSDNGNDWTLLYEHDGTVFLGFADQQPLSVDAAGSPARFVRVQVPGRNYLHLDELEVYAKGSDENIALLQPADQSSTSQWSTWDPLNRIDLAALTEFPTAAVIDRGLALAEDLRRLNADVDGSVEQLRALSRQLDELSPGADQAAVGARRELFLQANWIVRRLAFRNPLLDFDDLLLTKRVPGMFTHMSDQYYGWFSRPGGGLYVLENFKTDSPRLRLLTADLPPGNVLRPDLSHDGQRVLFAYCRHYPGLQDEPNKLDKSNVPEDAFYHLYEVRLDGTGLRRLTYGKYDDFDGRYLPDGRIVFLSTRRGQAVQVTSDRNIADEPCGQDDIYVRCGGGPERPVAVYTLHVMDPDGQRIVRISPFEMFEWTPSVDDQGQILYARWDYVDRHNMPYMSLWSTLPDGTDARAVYGNYTLNPHCIFEARRVPGSRMIVFTGSGHHAMTGGPLVLLDPNKGFDGEAPLTRLTPEVVFPESEGWPRTYYMNPFPLSESHYLVAWSDSPLPPGTPRPHWAMTGPPNQLGVYLFDAFGNLNLIYRDPAICSMYPLPIRPRQRPLTVSSRVEPLETSDARMVLVDVYQGLEQIPYGSIHRLRLVGIPAKTHPTMNAPQLGITHDDPGKFVLGTVPVEADGSAHFHVPPGVAFFLQALDEQGMAVQTMRSATYLQPGQTMTCIGCHEPRNTAPPNQFPLAIAREPSPITPDPHGSWPLDYRELVQPVLDTHCVSCHQEGAEASELDLTAEHSYESLVHYGTPSLRDHVWTRYVEGRSVVGAGAAHTNALWTLLDGDHYGVQLKEEDRLRLVIWMDTYGQRIGSFDARQEDELRRLRQTLAPILRE